MYVKRRKLISNIILIFVNISLFLYIAQNYSKPEVYKKNKYCKPRRRIGFLKTHKCASSSIQNILLRYVMNNDLNVVLRENDNYLGYRAQFNREMIANTSWEKAHLKYDMFLCHTRWNHSEISSVLSDDGNNEVFYFSILRDPVELYRSYWDYYNLTKLYKSDINTFAETVINNPIKYESKYKNKRPHAFNQMLTDFGFPFHDMARSGGINKTMGLKRLKEKVKEIDKTFNLVILADEEYFEDGIILLKHSLCWTNEDMINLKRNSFPDNRKSKLSEKSRKIIRSNKQYYFQLSSLLSITQISHNSFLFLILDWLWEDYYLYDYFKRQFLLRLEEIGRLRLEEEKLLLRNFTSKIISQCEKRKPMARPNICNYISKGEFSFLDEIRNIQREKSLKILELRNDTLKSIT